MMYEVGNVVRFQPQPSGCHLTGVIVARAVVGSAPPVYTVRSDGPRGEHYTLMQDDITLTAESFSLAKHLFRQAAFSERTFGPGLRTKGVCDHIRKELLEVEKDPSDVKEWIDVIILGFDGAWRTGATPEQIIDEIQRKQTKNEGRTWPDWRTSDPDKAIEHSRSAEEIEARRREAFDSFPDDYEVN